MTPKKNNQGYDEEELNEQRVQASENSVQETEEEEVIPINSYKSNVSTMDFDWDNVSNKKGDSYSADKRKTLEEAYDKTLSSVVENQVVEGTVIAVNSREVVVSIGSKSEGVISASEFRYNPELKKGDTVEVYVENQEDKNGSLVLSHKKARALRSWDRVNEALENDEIIKGYIKCRTKGGMIVDVFGIEAFLPG
jgi:small subunit ribosomal protein S1